MSLFGKKLDKQAQDLAYTIYLFFKKRFENPNSTEYQQNMKLFPTVAKATGLPENTIIKLVMKRKSKADISGLDETVFMKRYLVLDNIAKCEIKRRVMQFYSEYQKSPTLKTIHKTFIREKVLISTIAYLENLLQEVGFEYDYVDEDTKQKMFIECPSSVSARWDYLQSLNKYRDNKRQIIFIGETYISNTQKAGDDNMEVFRNCKEGGFIILHACDSKGFLKEALSITQTNFNRKHYLNDLSFEIFRWWLTNKLLPNVLPKSVIVMKNTSYYIDKPTNKSTKLEIETWLQKNNITYDVNLVKKDLLVIVNNHQSSMERELNEMIKGNGHEVLKIPASHADLNPVEWIWRNIRNQIWNSEQLTLTKDLKQQALESLLAGCTESEWQECQNQVKLLESGYYKYHENLKKTSEEMLGKIKQKQIILEDEEDSDSQEEMDISD